MLAQASPVRRTLLLCAALGLTLLTQACESDDDDDEVSVPVITPTTARLPATGLGQVVFTVEDGTPPYSWQVSNPALGVLASAEDTAIYTSAVGAGQNFVTVTDANGNAVSATITQQ